MQITALLVAVLLIGSVVAQSPPTYPPRTLDVTAKTCSGVGCTNNCYGATFPGGTCHQSRANSSESEELFCDEAGICMGVTIYEGPNCDGRVFPLAYSARRVSNQCDGADRCPFRWTSINYVGNFRAQINFNCTSDCATGCQYAALVDTRSCWNLGKFSGTIDSIDACNWVNADQFNGPCTRETVTVRNSIEEGVCFTEFNGLISSPFQCERGNKLKGGKVVKTIKKV